jgi:hypothetical protein
MSHGWRMRARAGARLCNADRALAVALFAGSFAYLHYFWPRTLLVLDEGAYLYEAKRVLQGQVMYRDFFDLIGPVSVYAMALAYALFDASMETARWSMAILQGAIVVLIYATARQLGVRPMLAAAVSLTHLALFYPALAFATPHWVSTVLTLVVFWFVLRGPVTRPGAAVAAGALTALVGLTLQSKGAATAAAVAIVLIRDTWAERRGRPLASLLARQLAAFAGGVLGLVLPTLGAFVYAAGFAPVYEALVHTPLVAYRQLPFHREGRWLLLGIDAALLRLLMVELSPMLLLNVMPFIIPISAARLLWQAATGVSAELRRPLFVAVVFSSLSIASVLYQPNYFHFAMVGPIWVSLFADLLERGVRRFERRSHGSFVAPAAALCVVLLLALQMRRSLTVAWTDRAAGDTAFGRVHFYSQSLADEVAAVRATLLAAGATDMFVYPTQPGMYLMTDTSNPTRFQLLIPGYTTAEQFAEVERTLERERVPFVVRAVWFWRKGDDPLLPYLQEHYERVRLPRQRGELPSLSLLRRKADRD